MSEPKNQMLKVTDRLSKSETLTKDAIIPHLPVESVHALTLTCKHYLNQYKDIYADKKVAAEMLHCVLNPTLPNQKRFFELLSTEKRYKNGRPRT